MLVILPPSETKRDGGTGRSSYLDALSFASLGAHRRSLVDQLVDLAADEERAASVLKLSARQRGEIDRNRALHAAAVMPAIDRYTGVLYDALDASTLTDAERQFAQRHVAIHSALFGPVAALDEIPAYRLSHSTRLPQGGVRQQWGSGIRLALARVDGLIVDLRSEGYSALGPLEASGEHVYVRVMSRSRDGQVRALNHFNKKTKGLFTRALVRSGLVARSVSELREWASGAGFELGAPDERGEAVLIAPSAESAPSSARSR